MCQTMLAISEPLLSFDVALTDVVFSQECRHDHTIGTSHREEDMTTSECMKHAMKFVSLADAGCATVRFLAMCVEIWMAKYAPGG